MSFTEVIAVGECALRRLPDGGLLRYQPADRSVRLLEVAASPDSCRAASLYTGLIPARGWSHGVGCAGASCGARSRRLVDVCWARA